MSEDEVKTAPIPDLEDKGTEAGDIDLEMLLDVPVVKRWLDVNHDYGFCRRSRCRRYF